MDARDGRCAHEGRQNGSSDTPRTPRCATERPPTRFGSTGIGPSQLPSPSPTPISHRRAGTLRPHEEPWSASSQRTSSPRIGADYISRLLRRGTPRMADFLAGFNLGDSSPGLLADDPSCTSFEDLQERLSHTIASKVTPTRAGRVSISLEFRAQARLTLDAAELDGDGNDLAALQAVVTGPKTKTIVVSQALSNQPQDNPVLQKAVAKRIVAAVAASDECAWTVREISRGSQGWTFTYICKDSTQQWQRQNAKESHMPVAGEYSNRAPDPRLMSARPYLC